MKGGYPMSFKAELDRDLVQMQYGLLKGTIVDVCTICKNSGGSLGPWCVIDHPSLPHVCYVNAVDLKMVDDELLPRVFG